MPEDLSPAETRQAVIDESDYTTADLKAVLQDPDWTSWAEVIRWLDQHPGEPLQVLAEARDAIRDDVSLLHKERVPFTLDPERVWDLTHSERRRHVLHAAARAPQAPGS